MGGGVDAAGEARDDHEICLADTARQNRRHLAPGGGGVARADDGDRGRGEVACVAANGDQGRRRIAMPEPGRVERLAERDKSRAEPRHRRHLVFGFGEACDAGRPGRSAAARETWERVERRFRRAEMIDQVAERDRSDVVAADETKPGQPLLVGQHDAARLDRQLDPPQDPSETMTTAKRSGKPRKLRPSNDVGWLSGTRSIRDGEAERARSGASMGVGRYFAPMRDSSPAMSRPIFARWRSQISAVRTSVSAAIS